MNKDLSQRRNLWLPFEETTPKFANLVMGVLILDPSLAQKMIDTDDSLI